MDFAIVAPTGPEFNVTLEILSNRTKLATAFPAESGIIAGAQVVCVQGGKGEGKTAATIADVVNKFQPRWIFLTGIAGGFRDKGIKRGDVLVSEFVYGYDFGKIEAGEFFHRPDYDFPPDAGLLAYAEALASSPLDKWATFSAIRPDNAAQSPAIHFGYFGSGDKVVDDPNNPIFAALKKSFPELHGVEMEAAGAAAAIRYFQASRAVGFLMVRGISDEVGPSGQGAGTAQRKEWKAYATAAAAEFIRLLITSLPTADTGAAFLRPAVQPSHSLRPGRRDFLEEICAAISKAKSEVVFLGGLSEDYLTENSKSVYAELLSAMPARPVTLTFIFESDSILFWRSRYLERPDEPLTYRSFEGLLEKQNRRSRLRLDILDKCVDAGASDRIKVRECYLPLYSTIIKVDDVLYVTPVTDRRGSQTPTFRLRLQEGGVQDEFTRSMGGYLRYFWSDGKFGRAEPYLRDPLDQHEEIVLAHDQNRFGQGWILRSAQKRISLETPKRRQAVLLPVAYGFLFRDDGRVLISRRSNLADDNQGLWDKSCGGHISITAGDTTSLIAIERELREELQVNSVRLRDVGSVPVVDEAVRAQNEGQWPTARLFECMDRKSVRLTPSGEFEALYVATCFLVICPAPHLIPTQTQAFSKTRWIDLDDLLTSTKDNPEIYTDDVIRLIRDFENELRGFARQASLSRKPSAVAP